MFDYSIIHLDEKTVKVNASKYYCWYVRESSSTETEKDRNKYRGTCCVFKPFLIGFALSYLMTLVAKAKTLKQNGNASKYYCWYVRVSSSTETEKDRNKYIETCCVFKPFLIGFVLSYLITLMGKPEKQKTKQEGVEILQLVRPSKRVQTDYEQIEKSLYDHQVFSDFMLGYELSRKLT